MFTSRRLFNSGPLYGALSRIQRLKPRRIPRWVVRRHDAVVRCLIAAIDQSRPVETDTALQLAGRAGVLALINTSAYVGRQAPGGVPKVGVSPPAMDLAQSTESTRCRSRDDTSLQARQASPCCLNIKWRRVPPCCLVHPCGELDTSEHRCYGAASQSSYIEQDGRRTPINAMTFVCRVGLERTTKGLGVLYTGSCYGVVHVPIGWAGASGRLPTDCLQALLLPKSKKPPLGWLSPLSACRT